MHLNIYFFHYAISEWNKLDLEFCNAKSYLVFRKSFLRFGRPKLNLTYTVHDPLGLILLTRVRLGLTQFNEYFHE